MTCPVCGKPRLLDAYSGEGGAGKGYMRAGFCVTPLDSSGARLNHYPVLCPGTGGPRLGDAIEYIVKHGFKYAAIHASPPCTGYSQATSMIPDRVAKYDRLIGATREALLIAGRPYVIENVTSAATRAELHDPVMLCWTQFFEPGIVEDTDGTPLWMRRHRLFETSFSLREPRQPHDHPRDMQCAGAYGGARRDKHEARHVRKGGYTPAVSVMRELLGTPWMTETGCKLSIPPVYAEFVGAQLMRHLDGPPAL